MWTKQRHSVRTSNILGAIIAICACLSPFAARAKEQAHTAGKKIEVMVLGTYHMNNPGRDVHNAQVDPMTTLDKQRQLKSVVDGLARFRPTAIALEVVADDQVSLKDQNYAAFTPAVLATSSDERAQIGYRLAALSGVTRVYGVDEKYPFPIENVASWAGAHDMTAELRTLGAGPQSFLKKLEARQKNETVATILRDVNDPDYAKDTIGQGASYYRFLQFGQGHDQPGAVLNGQWYTRNAIIFAKLLSVARPGDRIVIMFGAGHAYWLRHFVSTMPGFVLVDPRPYLRRR